MIPTIGIMIGLYTMFRILESTLTMIGMEFKSFCGLGGEARAVNKLNEIRTEMSEILR